MVVKTPSAPFASLCVLLWLPDTASNPLYLAANTLLIGIHLQHVLRPIRIVLQRRNEILCYLCSLLLSSGPMHPLYQKAAGLTETIIAAAIEVHRDKGPGLIESIYI